MRFYVGILSVFSLSENYSQTHHVVKPKDQNRMTEVKKNVKGAWPLFWSWPASTQ